MTAPNSPSSSHVNLFPLGEDQTPYRKLSSDFVSTIELDGKTFLKVEKEGIRLLAEEAFADIKPATTMVEVSRLIDSNMLVEIEFTAYLRG